ncbi:Putative mycofactocin biosynthesis glycosyltransferase MftF [Frondihabitans sp. 762G35]|uniref:glycosyltransferase n=1 Tax=Frondihabitans sp. 762G35 TaxID=1446794 RepID=UPI000D20B80D|nr:glycosyltransferase family 2 protein [Frondihabitans sp. 762G35]ARC55647.1 Putative mycofactocin biosynthesis glycosyltransferase MftF [Frondihabitans sp. 762G35]
MTASTPTVSVIVCAYTQRRWQDLQDSVESARAQAEATEVIVVIDHEPALLAMAQDRWPTLTVIANEQTQGLSGARNTGVGHATSEIVAFLDDDATADADWLTWMLDSFSDPNVAGVGGHAEPVWPDAKGPALYADELLWIVGCSYRGLPTEHADVRNVIGCTMAFRRAAIVTAGGFSTAVGRVGNIPLGGEETELCITIRQADPAARICYEPMSLVNHRVSADRATWRYLSRRSFYEGVSKAVLSRTLGRGDSLSSESSYLTRVLPGAFLRELSRTGRGGGKRAAAIALTVLATVAGYALGAVSGAKASDSGSVVKQLERAAVAR